MRLGRVVGSASLAAQAVIDWISHWSKSMVTIRIVGGVAAASALVLAAPSPYLVAILLLGAALVVAVVASMPGSALPTLVGLLCVVGMIFSRGAGAGHRIYQAAAVATLLYVMHAACALAAVVPLDAIVASQVWQRWATRVVLVVTLSLAGTVPIAVILVEEPAWSAAAPLGVVAAAGLVGLVVVLARPSPGVRYTAGGR